MTSEEIAARWEEAITLAGLPPPTARLAVPVGEMRAMLDGLAAARAKAEFYRTACQTVQEGKAANDARWHNRWANLKRHMRDQERELGRISDERDAARAKIVWLRADAERLESRIDALAGEGG